MAFLSAMTAQDVADHLSRAGYRVQSTRNGYKVCCPAHADRTPSLQLRDGSDKLLYHCFAGCDAEDVRKKLQAIVGDERPLTEAEKNSVRERRVVEEDPWEVLPSVPADFRVDINDFQHHVLGAPTKIWTYRHRDDSIAGWIARYEQENGDKEVIPYSWCKEKGSSRSELRQRGMASPRPLYNLQELLAKPDAPVAFNEGEKAADAAKAMFESWVSTTISGGGNAIKMADLEPLYGRLIIVMTDHDGPGHQLAHMLLDRLHGKSEIRMLVWPDQWPSTMQDAKKAGTAYVQEKGDDAADHRARGWNAELLRQYCAERGVNLTLPFLPVGTAIAG